MSVSCPVARSFPDYSQVRSSTGYRVPKSHYIIGAGLCLHVFSFGGGSRRTRGVTEAHRIKMEERCVLMRTPYLNDGRYIIGNTTYAFIFLPI